MSKKKPDTAFAQSSRHRSEKPELAASKSSSPNTNRKFLSGCIRTFQNSPSDTGKAKTNAPEILPVPVRRPRNRRRDFSLRRNLEQTDFRFHFLYRLFSPLRALFRRSFQSLFRPPFFLNQILRGNLP